MNIKIGDVAATSFVTLYCHAIESQSKDPILNDSKAVEITHELNKIMCNTNNKLERDFAEGKLDKQLVVQVAIRAKQYDRYVGKFFGIRDSNEMEEWHIGINILDYWSYFDSKLFEFCTSATSFIRETLYAIESNPERRLK
jgi:O-methyltransferase involved in polyketide biosynthesis